jgi:hypothetical protein
MMGNMQAVDSLVANEFSFEINGQPVTGLFRITGLTTYKLDDNGNRVNQPFEVAKMVQRDGSTIFNKWLRETRANHGKVTRDLAIVAIDDGIETRRWTVKGAWIQAVRYSEFNTASFEMVEEIVTIMYDDIEESWPATPNIE